MKDCNDDIVYDTNIEGKPKKLFRLDPVRVYLVVWSGYDGEGIDKIFYDVKKAQDYIQYRDKMTGLDYSILEKEVDDARDEIEK